MTVTSELHTIATHKFYIIVYALKKLEFRGLTKRLVGVFLAGRLKLEGETCACKKSR